MLRAPRLLNRNLAGAMLRHSLAATALLTGAFALACGDNGNATISSAGTLAANATPPPPPTPTEEATPENIYRSQVATLSAGLQSEFSELGRQLQSAQLTDDYVRSVTTQVTEVQTRLDLLKRLNPPIEKYVAFDQSLDVALEAYQAGLTELTVGLQASDLNVVERAASKLVAASASFQSASALMPEK